MKTAFTTWIGRIAPVFDVAGHAELITSENSTCLSQTTLELPNGSVMEKITCLANAGTDTLVCGAISRQALALANTYNITVYPFIGGKAPEVIQAWLKDRCNSSNYSMPGCGNRKQCSRRNRGGSRSGNRKMK